LFLKIVGYKNPDFLDTKELNHNLENYKVVKTYFLYFLNYSRCEGSARIFGVGISAFDPSLPGIFNR